MKTMFMSVMMMFAFVLSTQAETVIEDVYLQKFAVQSKPVQLSFDFSGKNKFKVPSDDERRLFFSVCPTATCELVDAPRGVFSNVKKNVEFMGEKVSYYGYSVAVSEDLKEKLDSIMTLLNGELSDVAFDLVIEDGILVDVKTVR